MRLVFAWLVTRGGSKGVGASLLMTHLSHTSETGTQPGALESAVSLPGTMF